MKSANIGGNKQKYMEKSAYQKLKKGRKSNGKSKAVETEVEECKKAEYQIRSGRKD